MAVQTLDISTLEDPLRQALTRYEGSFLEEGLSFGRCGPLQPTTEKPYTAKAAVPVIIETEKVGDLYVLVFQPGDGTGDASTFESGQLTIPEALHYDVQPERVYPQAKTGVLYEGYFPLFSAQEGKIFPYATSLDILTLSDNQAITIERTLGLDP